MSIQAVRKNLEALYAKLPIATALFQRDENGVWSKLWQNTVATSIWGEFDVASQPVFKLELMDALSKVVPSSFEYEIENTVESYQFIAIPHEEDLLIVQFIAGAADAKGANENGSLYEGVIAASNLGVFDWDINEDSIQFNQRAYDVMGASTVTLGNTYQQMLGRIHEDDLEEVTSAIEGHLDSGWPLSLEFRVRNERNHYQWIGMKGQAEWSGDLPIRLVGILDDISERKHVEIQLKQREALIEQMIDALPMSIYVKDAQGCYRFFNKQAETNTGRERNDLIGRTDFEVYPIPQAMRKAETDKNIQLSEKLSIYEAEADEGDKDKWWLYGKVPIRVLQPNKPYETWLLSFSLDITERKQMEEALKEARVIAEQAAKDKANFLSVMSHEIRTPLNSVIGNAGLLLSESLDDQLAQHVEMIKRSGEHLLYLINDILDFNKLEAGKVELELQPFDLQKQVQTVVEMTKTNAEVKGIYLKTDIHPELSQWYLGDEGRLRQVLLNLIGNAIKFTSKGGVTVRVLPSPYSEKMRFEVVDTGIGISEENIPKLFSEFAQAESSTSRKFGGTGLGLAISKKLVEAMHGSIGIESKEGEGSTFWFEIPFEATEEVAQDQQNKIFTISDDVLVKDLSILVAEDNLPNQFLIKSILSKLGHRVEIANNGLEACEMIGSDGFSYDIVLMDMQMPEMSGVEATKQIRTMEGAIGQIPIVALTGNGVDEIRSEITLAGMNGYLSKPINLDELKACLQMWGKRPS